MTEGQYQPGNETYCIEMSSPLLRPGIRVSTEVSGRYVVRTMQHMMQCVREFNDDEKARRSGLEDSTA